MVETEKPTFKSIGPFTFVITEETIKFKEGKSTLITIKKSFLKELLEL